NQSLASRAASCVMSRVYSRPLKRTTAMSSPLKRSKCIPIGWSSSAKLVQVRRNAWGLYQENLRQGREVVLDAKSFIGHETGQRSYLSPLMPRYQSSSVT